MQPPTRPMVVAHRGASTSTAEHTLDAYVTAIESGADALECDVRMTRDGHLVCVHDRTVNRTSDGHGVVSDLDLDGLNALNFSSWHSDLPSSADQLLTDSPYLAGVAPDRVEPDGGVLTLERLLELVHDAPGRSACSSRPSTRRATRAWSRRNSCQLLARFGWAGDPGPETSLRHPANLDNRVIVMSFAPTALRRVKLLAPDVPTVLLLDRLLPRCGATAAAGRACRSPGPACACCGPRRATSPGPRAGPPGLRLDGRRARGRRVRARPGRGHDHHEPAREVIAHLDASG